MTRLFTIIGIMLVIMAPTGASAEFKLRYVDVKLQDQKEVAFIAPEGVACSPKSVVVADTGNSRLVTFDLQNGELTGGTEVRVPQFVYPVKLAVLPRNELLVLDSRTKKIIRVSDKGAFTGYFEIKGPSGNERFQPKAIAIDGAGQVYILDSSQARVMVADADGRLIRSVGLLDGAGVISDIAVDPQGAIFALDSVAFKVYRAAAGGQEFSAFSQNLKEYLEFPSHIASGRGGRLYVTDQNGNAVVALGPDGTFQGRQLVLGWKPGSLYYPAQICLTDDMMFIADRNNNRIQSFKLAW